MRSNASKEALGLYRLMVALLDQAHVDKLQIDDRKRTTIKRDGNVTTLTWAPYGTTITGLCVVHAANEPPFVVTFSPGAWCRLIRNTGHKFDADLAEA